MVTCPACGASNSDTREYCLGCMGELSATHAPNRGAGGGTGPGTGATDESIVQITEGMTAAAAVNVSNVSAAPAASFESEALTIPGSSCPRHPAMVAAGTCMRCGTFFCARCVASVLEKNIECPSCLESKEARDAPATVKALIREQWIALALSGLLVGALGFVGVIAAPERLNHGSDITHFTLAGLMGAILALPFAIAALVVGLVRRVWASWLGYVIEVSMFGLLVLTSLGFNLITAIAIGMPFWSLSRVLRLAALVKKYPTTLAASRSA